MNHEIHVSYVIALPHRVAVVVGEQLVLVRISQTKSSKEKSISQITLGKQNNSQEQEQQEAGQCVVLEAGRHACSLAPAGS